MITKKNNWIVNIKIHWKKQRRNVKRVGNNEKRSRNTYKGNGFEQSKTREKKIIEIVKKIHKRILKNRS